MVGSKVLLHMIILALVVVTWSLPSVDAQSGGDGRKPNIVFLLLDDWDKMLGSASPAVMPKLHSHVVSPGTRFSNYYINMAACCPSRVGILTGLCTHNSGVIWNQASGLGGGWSRFNERELENETVAVWLKQAGYRTALMGKYLNGYGSRLSQESPVPKGWDDWFAFLKIGYFNWTASEDGVTRRFGDKDVDYSTDVLTRRAVDYLEKSAAGPEQPFFLYVAPYAPHSPAIPAPRHETAFGDAKVPRAPNYNSDSLASGKVTALKKYPPFSEPILEFHDILYRKRLQTLLAVDEMVEAVVETLDRTGLLNNTYIFVSSDNGFHTSHHRMSAGKTSPYEEDVHVPLFVRGPTVGAGVTLPHLVTNTDMAPTLAGLGGVEVGPPRTPPVDGLSFAQLLTHPDPLHFDAQDVRTGILIEKLFDQRHPTYVTDEVWYRSNTDDPFAGYRSAPESAFSPTLGIIYESWGAILNASELYTSNTVNKGAYLSADGLGLAPFSNPTMINKGDGTAKEGAGYYASLGVPHSMYSNALGFMFPSLYYGVRLSSRKVGELVYIEYVGIGRELYNLTEDPFQMVNVFGSISSALAVDLQATLDQLKTCRGQTCKLKNLNLAML